MTRRAGLLQQPFSLRSRSGTARERVPLHFILILLRRDQHGTGKQRHDEKQPGFHAPVLPHLAMYVYTTGVRYRVMTCDTSSPPPTVRPSGRRASPPAPSPSAIGIAPNIVAMLVIMIGRKRMTQPS